jgi:hypothetical protein
MKKILRRLYKFTLMPHLERDRYFEEVVDDAMIYCDKLAKEITNKP